MIASHEQLAARVSSVFAQGATEQLSPAATDAELELLEKEAMALEDGAVAATIRATIRSHRAFFAMEDRRYSDVVDLSQSLVEGADLGPFEAFNNHILRARSLHELGRHEQEVSEALTFARRHALGDLFFLTLADVLSRHPTACEVADDLVARAVGELPAVQAMGYVGDIEQVAGTRQLAGLSMEIEEAWRRVNRKKRREILGD
jgi:hypothetical protein